MTRHDKSLKKKSPGKLKSVHALLKRQLERCFGPHKKLSGDIATFCATVDSSYKKNDARKKNYDREIGRLSEENASLKESLRQSELNVKFFLKNADDAIYWLDPQGKYMQCNPAGERLLKAQGETLMGRHFTDFVAPEARRQVLKFYLDQALKRIPSTYCEFPAMATDGTVFWVGQHIQCITENDLIIGFQAIARDITAVKRHEERLGQLVEERTAELTRMRHYLQSTIDSMPSILIGVDKDLTVTQWNISAAASTGTGSDDAVGKPLKDLLPDVPVPMDLIRTSLEEGQAQKIEKLSYLRGNETRYLNFMVYPLTSGGFDEAVIRIDDITSRVRIEEMMVQTEKMFSLGGLAAGMAHEINNPLSGILMGAETVLRRFSPEHPRNSEHAEQCGIDLKRVREYMEVRGIRKTIEGIRELGIRSATIVENMLNFGSQDKQRHEEIDLGLLLGQTVQLAEHDYDLKKKYDFRHIKIIRQFSPGVPPVACISTEIEQVLLNLLRNAAQAMTDKNYQGDTPAITLRLYRKDPWAVIEVEDNGPGISERIRKRIFEPFYSTKPTGVGTGLGLSVSFFIITKNHHGELLAHSIPGSGTTFVIKLPLDPDKGG